MPTVQRPVKASLLNALERPPRSETRMRGKETDEITKTGCKSYEGSHEFHNRMAGRCSGLDDREARDVRLAQSSARAKDFQRLLAEFGGLRGKEITTRAGIGMPMINRGTFGAPRGAQTVANHRHQRIVRELRNRTGRHFDLIPSHDVMRKGWTTMPDVH
jgi:hypothetical protein